jgi:hypothetical protein
MISDALVPRQGRTGQSRPHALVSLPRRTPGAPRLQFTCCRSSFLDASSVAGDNVLGDPPHSQHHRVHVHRGCRPCRTDDACPRRRESRECASRRARRSLPPAHSWKRRPTRAPGELAGEPRRDWRTRTRHRPVPDGSRMVERRGGVATGDCKRAFACVEGDYAAITGSA